MLSWALELELLLYPGSAREQAATQVLRTAGNSGTWKGGSLRYLNSVISKWCLRA